MRRLLALGVTVLATAAMAAEPVAFRAEARVEVDPNGKPVKIEASADLPEAIRAYVERRVARWTFSPPARDGVTGSAVTYLSLGACAIPTGDGYRLGLDLKGNGPKIHGNGGRLPPLAYPSAALGMKIEMEAEVVFVAEPDGRATLEQIKYADGGKHRNDGFDAALRGWVASMRFEPEQLAGTPVRTRTSASVQFVLSGRHTPPTTKKDLVERAARTPECRMGSGEDTGLLPVALDSPIKVIEAI